jgi:hypothetical protein
LKLINIPSIQYADFSKAWLGNTSFDEDLKEFYKNKEKIDFSKIKIEPYHQPQQDKGEYFDCRTFEDTIEEFDHTLLFVLFVVVSIAFFILLIFNLLFGFKMLIKNLKKKEKDLNFSKETIPLIN